MDLDEANGRECEFNEIIITNDEPSNFVNDTNTTNGLNNNADIMDENEHLNISENAQLLSN